SEATIKKLPRAAQSALDQPLFDNRQDGSLDHVAQQVITGDAKSLAVDLKWDERLARLHKIGGHHQISRATPNVDTRNAHRTLGSELSLGLRVIDGSWSRSTDKVEVCIGVAGKAFRDFTIEVDKLCAARLIE